MIISLMSRQGGSGRSTLTFNLASAAAATGLNVLVIEADPQGSIAHILRRRSVSSTKTLSDTLITFISCTRAATLQILDRARGEYSAIFIDPGRGNNTFLRKLASQSDLVFVPLSDLEGTRTELPLLKQLVRIKSNGARVPVLTAKTKYQNPKLHAELNLKLPSSISKHITESSILLRYNVSYDNASRLGLSVIDQAPMSTTTRSLKKLYTEMTLSYRDTMRRLLLVSDMPDIEFQPVFEKVLSIPGLQEGIISGTISNIFEARAVILAATRPKTSKLKRI